MRKTKALVVYRRGGGIQEDALAVGINVNDANKITGPKQSWFRYDCNHKNGHI